MSKGNVSAIASWVMGGVNYCKVTKHGIPHKNFDGNIEFNGEECRVSVRVKDVSE